MNVLQMNLRKHNSGITLIALVITIIVLLILAGVSLSLIMGNDGILGRAENASEKNLIAHYKEQIELARADAKIINYDSDLTVEKLKNYFDVDCSEDWVNSTEIIKDNEIDKLKLITDDGYIFYITENITEYKGIGDVMVPEAIPSEMVQFTPADTSWKAEDGSDITNVKQALDYLYNN